MAYTDEAVKSKLSALNETQESIVTVAQWVMFHRRHADRTASLWLQKLKDSGSNKRLNLIYLANEVAQQSKARKKDDFLIAFSPIIAEATSCAYKGATGEVQSKLRRSVEVWRNRQIFETPIQEAIEARIDELDKSRSSTKKPALGGSLFSSSAGSAAPPEIQPLVPLQNVVSKSGIAVATAVPSAQSEYDKLMNPENTTPTPPVFAARLSALLKNLASAETAVSESLKARQALILGLEKLLETNKSMLASEEIQHATLSNRKVAIETKKRDVEDGIMRSLAADEAQKTGEGQGSPITQDHNRTASHNEPERPDVEALTPPPADSEALLLDNPDTETTKTSAISTNGDYHLAPTEELLTPNDHEAAYSAPLPQVGADLLSSLNIPPVRQFAGTATENGGTVTKKRKLDDESAMFQGSGDDPLGELDDDVAELLREEGGG